MRFLSNITILIGALVTTAACGGGPIQPPPPPPEQIQIACPAAIEREATSPQGTDVHFEPPTPTGGTAPYTVQCDPGSSSIFPVGETTVRCTAMSAMMAQASCSFAVTVRISQTIAKTKFTAFGDSITEGTVSLTPLLMLDGPETYPFKLEQMLLQRYASQPIVVINRGLGGERTDRALDRLRVVLDEDKPEVMLLLEGINAINSLSTSVQASALRSMIIEAQRRGVDVIIATLMPILPTSHLYQPGNTTSKIQALNAQIFALAAQYNLGAPVDLFAIFNANQALIGPDGLHPTAEGQTRIAEAFRDEVVGRYDRKSTTSLGLSTMLRIR